LNEITRYTGDENGVADKHQLNGNSISGAPALEQLNEKQKQQVCANVLSAIVGVAVYLKDDQVKKKRKNLYI
jgi:phosphatidylinositol 4-kinase